MTKEQARKLVIATYFFLILFITADELYVKKAGLPNPSRFVGLTVAWLIAGIITEVSPSTGAGLAGLATLGMVLTDGQLLNKLPGTKGFDASPPISGKIPPKAQPSTPAVPTPSIWNWKSIFGNIG